MSDGIEFYLKFFVIIVTKMLYVCVSQFLRNLNGYNLGTRQTGEVVSDGMFYTSPAFCCVTMRHE